MAWTTPKTWASGYVVLAADLNTHLRDNLNVTAPAVLTTAGDILYASGANTPARLAKSTTSTQYLANTGTSNAPAWNEVALDTGISGTLPVGNGGTGATTFTANGILVGNSTSAVAVTATMATKGHLMIGDGSGVPTMLGLGDDDQVLTADSGEATGVKWAAAGGAGALVLIGTVVASASATLTVTGLDSTYDTYLILIADLHPTSNGNDLRFRVGDSGGVDSASGDYAFICQTLLDSSTSYASEVSNGATSIVISDTGQGGPGTAVGEGFGAALWLHRPGDGVVNPLLTGHYAYLDGGDNLVAGAVFGERTDVITLDRVEISLTASTFASGRMSVFGYKHA